jgi:hypothetical protein
MLLAIQIAHNITIISESAWLSLLVLEPFLQSLFVLLFARIN